MGNRNSKTKEDRAIEPRSTNVCSEKRLAELEIEKLVGRQPPKRRKVVVIGGKENKYTESNEYEHQCPTCQNILSCKSSLTRHMKQHLPDEERTRFECTVCPKFYYSKQYYRMHLESHLSREESKDVTCTICGKVCSTKRSLLAHSRTHTQNKIIQHTEEYEMEYQARHACPCCDKRFHKVENLSYHKQIYLPKRERAKHHCSVCKKKFFSRQVLKLHIRTHFKRE